MSRHIREVKSVTTTWEKTNPPQLVINAAGEVGSTGWTNGRLEPRFYIDFPQDGIQDFDFVADPPREKFLTMMTPIAAETIRWENPPSYLKGVRVHAQINAIEEKF